MPGDPANTDAHLLQPGWRERIVRAGGIDLHVIEAGRPGDPAVMLLHGFPEFWWAWRAQIAPLAEAGFHVIAPDLRGYNRSDAPEGLEGYRLDVLADDVIALADALGIERFCLAAHDWGAVIGWWTAARHPERIDRAVLIAGPHPDAWAAEIANPMQAPMQALRSAYIALFQIPRLPEAILRAFGFARLKAAMRRSARRGTFDALTLGRYASAWTGRLTAMLAYYRALRLNRADGAPARVSRPVLVLWGDRDRFLGRGVMEASLALCDQGRMVTLTGGTHWLHHEEPERIGAEIVEFLRDDPYL